MPSEGHAEAYLCQRRCKGGKDGGEKGIAEERIYR
jgi:hypothetical protein